MKFKNRKRGQVYIIAEVGINHNGDLNEAKALIKAAFEAGADAAKIQVRDLSEVYTKSVLADPLTAEQGTQYLLNELQKAHLSQEQVRELTNYARQFNFDFFATPFDQKSAVFLQEIGLPLFKVGSPDFSNLPLLKTICSFKKPMILSTGMSDESEIDKVITFLKNEKADFSLLHCNSTYPAAFADLNLKYIPKLREVSGVEVGYSGHEQGYSATLAAVALGAEIVERHITRDRAIAGPDHSSSLNFEQFGQMVQEIRKVELSLGEAIRHYSQGEMSNRLSLAKSLVAATDLKAGTRLRAEHLAAKTPAKGVSPLEMNQFVGQVLAHDVTQDQYLFPKDLTAQAEAILPAFDINRHWGVVGRLNDFRDFIDLKPKLIEIHMTWRDLLTYQRPAETFSQDLVVHAPEYYQDKLIDFTSEDAKVTEYSIEMLRRTIEVARDLNGSFQGQTNPKGPRVVVHPGGHFAKKSDSNRSEQYRLLKKRLKEIDSSGVQLLVENMPPYPWYFGGQWFNTIFMDAKEIAQFAEDMNWGFCYDTSHALLYCNYAGTTIRDFTKNVLSHTAYLHISDGKGTNQEGLQLGMGDLQKDDLIELLTKINVGFIPEIWQGHLNSGQGFKEALGYIQNLLEKSSGLTCSDRCTDPTHNHSE